MEPLEREPIRRPERDVVGADETVELQPRVREIRVIGVGEVREDPFDAQVPARDNPKTKNRDEAMPVALRTLLGKLK